jgi:hypothetical protein
VLAEGRRSAAHIDRDMENPDAQHVDQLDLREWRRLNVIRQRVEIFQI